MNLSRLSSKELLAHLVQIEDLLRARNITHSSNNLVAGLAESLFREAYKWQPADNSQRGFDAIDKKTRERYQIKGRRCIGTDKSPMLGAIRNLSDKHKPFDFLAVVIFSKDYEITYAALIDYTVVKQKAKQQTHTNSCRYVLNPESKEARVQDVTKKLRAVASKLLRSSEAFPTTRDKLLET